MGIRQKKMKILIRNDQRLVFVGATGSGKTVLAKHFLPRLNRVVVIDPKHTFKLDGFKARRTVPMIGKQWRIVYRPRPEDDEDLADFCDDLFRMKNVTIYIDELSTLAERYPTTTAVIADIARTGRERHVAVWSALQRPRWVPRVFFTEAEGVFMFNLRSGEDRAYMAQFTGPEVLDPIEKFSFWYANADDEHPALMRFNINKNFIESLDFPVDKLLP